MKNRKYVKQVAAIVLALSSTEFDKILFSWRCPYMPNYLFKSTFFHTHHYILIVVIVPCPLLETLYRGRVGPYHPLSLYSDSSSSLYTVRNPV